MAGIESNNRPHNGADHSPKEYKPYLDPVGRDPLKNMKEAIYARFPGISNIEAFHERKSDIGGNMLIRFDYKGDTIQLKMSPQQMYNTFTSIQEGDRLIQGLTGEEQGVANFILLHVRQLEKKKESTKASTRASLNMLSDETTA